MFGLFIKICLIDEDETITECILRLFQNGVKAPWKNEGRSCCSSTFISTVWNKPADTCNSLNTVQSRQIPTTSALWLHAWSQCVLLVNQVYISYSSICRTAAIERRREMWPIGKHVIASKLMDV